MEEVIRRARQIKLLALDVDGGDLRLRKEIPPGRQRFTAAILEAIAADADFEHPQRLHAPAFQKREIVWGVIVIAELVRAVEDRKS